MVKGGIKIQFSFQEVSKSKAYSILKLFSLSFYVRDYIKTKREKEGAVGGGREERTILFSAPQRCTLAWQFWGVLSRHIYLILVTVGCYLIGCLGIGGHKKPTTYEIGTSD
jgi:hypothetical protein